MANVIEAIFFARIHWHYGKFSFTVLLFELGHSSRAAGFKQSQRLLPILLVEELDSLSGGLEATAEREIPEERRVVLDLAALVIKLINAFSFTSAHNTVPVLVHWALRVSISSCQLNILALC